MTSLLSISIPRWYITFICVYILIFTTFLRSTAAVRENKYNYQKLLVINDLPGEEDLNKYLSAFEKLLFFITMHKHYVDITMSFGLFIANVNVRSILKCPLHDDLKMRFGHLLVSTDDILEYFYKTVLNHKPEHRKLLRPLLSLYMNDTSWLFNLQRLNIDLLIKTKFFHRRDLEVQYSKWSIYKTNIYVDAAEPNPSNEDDCFNLLAQNPVYDTTKHNAICHVPFSCASLVRNGPDFGFAMKNRLLLVIVAWFSRDCNIGDYGNRKQFTDGLCAKIYNEAEYIAFHDFEEPTLVLEQIVLCSLLGHAQFLRESWIDDLMEFETAIGCFSIYRPVDDNSVKSLGNTELKDWEYMTSKATFWEGSCYRNITGSGFAMLASVLRYIIETYHSKNT